MLCFWIRLGQILKEAFHWNGSSGADAEAEKLITLSFLVLITSFYFYSLKLRKKMLYNFVPYSKFPKLVAYIPFFHFVHTAKKHYRTTPFPYIHMFLSLFSSTNHGPHSYFDSDSSTTNSTSHLVETENSYDANDGFGKMGFNFSNAHCQVYSDGFSDEVEESDEERGQGNSSCTDRNQGTKMDEDWRRIEIHEDEFRHPLVREICRLIECRSAWNHKLEGKMRHLLRGLKPRLVCAVLLS